MEPDIAVLKQASPAQLEQAAADNHRQLFHLNAVVKGGEVRSAAGLSWTYTGAGNGAEIVFPALDADTADTILDQLMDYYRTHIPNGVGCWSLAPAQPVDIGIRLLARGFQPGWQPCWMILDLQQLPDAYRTPAGLHIHADNSATLSGIKDMPYGDDNGYMSQPLLHSYPEKAQRFTATLDNKIVGQTCLFLTTGPLGNAGIYNVGVLPAYRNQGIGKALVEAACRYAKEKGYVYASLNANEMGRPVYQQLGFRIIGYGLTWWLMGQDFITRPHSPALVKLAEAIGRGDMAVLENFGQTFTVAELNTPLINKMTLLQLAAHCRQPAAAQWLVSKGARYSALDAWDLGWPQQAAELLAHDPQEVNRRYYDWNGTLLHIAAERNDLELAKLALMAGVDLSLQDTMHHGIGLGWAIFFRREAIVDLIKKHMAETGQTADE
ncbi:MAG: GNAT family N-acetyltransferase [Chitinophagaceae bacterium]